MSGEIRAGDTVRCVDATSKREWSEWYMDTAYAEDMLTRGERYLVREVAERDGCIGYDVGVHTPWGDRFWAAERFERSLLRLASKVSATLPNTQEGRG